MATAKQIAARKLFAARVKAGEFKRKENPTAAAKKKPSISEAVAQMRIWTRNDMEYPDAEWRASQKFGYSAEKLRAAYDDWYDREQRLPKSQRTNAPKREKNPIAKEKMTARAYVLRPSQATKAAPNKRLITRRTKALKAPKGYFPNPEKLYWCVDKSSNGFDWSRVGYFENKTDAEQYARAYSDAHYNKMRVYKGSAHRML